MQKTLSVRVPQEEASLFYDVFRAVRDHFPREALLAITCNPEMAARMMAGLPAPAPSEEAPFERRIAKQLTAVAILILALI